MGVSGAVLSFVLAICVGGFSGGTTGIAVSRLKITPFIVTLGMMVICRGLTLIISSAQAVAPLGDTLGKLSSDYLPADSSLILLSIVGIGVTLFLFWQWFQQTITVPELIKTLAANLALCGGGIYIFCNYRGIPYMVFISVICALSGIFILKYTRLGRFIYAIGGNPEAAELSGVPVAKTLWVTYFIMGCLAGLAGVMDSARVNKIRRGDDDGVNIVAADDFLVAGRGGGDAGLLPGAFERGGIRVAERDDLGVRAKGESGEMVLQRDAAATDDGEVELLHLSGQNLMSGEYVGPRGKGKPVAV